MADSSSLFFRFYSLSDLNNIFTNYNIPQYHIFSMLDLSRFLILDGKFPQGQGRFNLAWYRSQIKSVSLRFFAVL